MNEMIEKVARAIHFRGEDGGDDAWNHCQPYLRDIAREQARGAIEAMREPTDYMSDRATEGFYGITRERAGEIAKTEKWDGHRLDLVNQYQTFIAAALSP